MALEISAKAIGLDVANAKLLYALPRILETNRAMVTAALEEVRAVVASETPIGPGHFGYHLKNSFKVEVSSKGLKTSGALKAPPTGYWREFGTLDRFRRANLGIALRLGATSLTNRESSLGGIFGGTGGERAFMTAHKAGTAVKKFIKVYYGSMSAWWRAK